MEVSKDVAGFFDEIDPRFFKVFSEPARIEILRFLMLKGKSDIAQIAEAVPQDRSVVSRHLQLMEEAGILVSFKEGRHIFYNVNAEEFLGIFERLSKKAACCVKARCC